MIREVLISITAIIIIISTWETYDYFKNAKSSLGVKHQADAIKEVNNEIKIIEERILTRLTSGQSTVRPAKAVDNYLASTCQKIIDSR